MGTIYLIFYQVGMGIYFVNTRKKIPGTGYGYGYVRVSVQELVKLDKKKRWYLLIKCLVS